MDQDSRRYLALRAPAATLQGHTECLQSGAKQVAIPDPPAVQNALVHALAVPRRTQANRSAHGQAEHAKREKRQEKEGESKSRRERERKKRARGRKREKEREKKGEGERARGAGE